MTYDWDFNSIWQYRDVLAIGFSWTVLLTVAAIILGSTVGLLWALVLSSNSRSWLEARLLASSLNAVVRAIPLLILLLIVNYYGPPFLGITSLFAIACVALSLNLAAFVADVLRGAIRRVPATYSDAGLSLGMTQSQVLRRVVLPEALRSTIPSLSLLYIDILKMSSLASVIGYRELAYSGSLISAKEFRPLEAFAAIALLYIALVLPLAAIQHRLEDSKWVRRRS